MRSGSFVPPEPPPCPVDGGLRTTRRQRLVRGGAMLLHSVGVWAAARWLCPRLSASGRLALLERCAARTLALLRVRVVARGRRPHDTGPCLVVANHVSWLDIYVLNAVRGARYVAKAEVAGWPLAGAIARGFETLFIVRRSLRDAKRVKDEVATALRRGQRVVVFPEGTTTDGAAVGRFYAALFQAAVDTGTPVQPVAIRYRTPDGRRDEAAAFVGDMTFVESLRNVLRRPELVAETTWGPLVLPHGLDRRDLVEITHRFVRLTLGADPHDEGTTPLRIRKAA